MNRKKLLQITCVLLSLIVALNCLIMSATAETVYAASVGNVQYTTVAEAVAKANGQPVKLLMDSRETVTSNGDLYLDLNGHTLVGLSVVNGTLYGMDSTTDDYDCANGYGKILNLTGTYAPHHKTEITGSIRRYLAVEENGAVSFHRFYVGLTYASMRPSDKGVGYKAVFAGDSLVKSKLHADGAFGYTLRLDGHTPVSVWKGVSEFVPLKTVTLLLSNFDAEHYGETNLHATAKIKLTDGTEIAAATYNCTMRQIMETVNDTYTEYTDKQIGLLAAWIEEVPVMLQWRTENIVPREITGPAFVVSDATAQAGQQVQVKIAAVNNPGVTSIRLNIAYNDSVLKLTNMTYNSAIGGTGIPVQGTNTSSPVTAYWADGFKDVTGDWDFVTLTFDVADNAKAGDYGITVTYSPDDVYDANEDNVAFGVVNGKITVDTAAQLTEPTFVVSSTTAQAGQKQVQIKVAVVNNPGVTSIRLNIAYDDTVLKLTDMTYNSAIGGTGIPVQGTNTASPVTAYWAEGFKNVTGDWDFVTLTFDVMDYAKAGDYSVTVTYSPDDVYDVNEDNVAFDVVNGKITVS